MRCVRHCALLLKCVCPNCEWVGAHPGSRGARDGAPASEAYGVGRGIRASAGELCSVLCARCRHRSGAELVCQRGVGEGRASTKIRAEKDARSPFAGRCSPRWGSLRDGTDMVEAQACRCRTHRDVHVRALPAIWHPWERAQDSSATGHRLRGICAHWARPSHRRASPSSTLTVRVTWGPLSSSSSRSPSCCSPEVRGVGRYERNSCIRALWCAHRVGNSVQSVIQSCVAEYGRRAMSQYKLTVYIWL